MAFRPARLPPSIDLAELAEPLGDARAAIGELKGACRRLQNPMILIRPLQRREALTSSAMEGTYSTEDELVLTEAGLEPAPSDDTQEVANFVRALSGAAQRIRDEPITTRLIRDTHSILMSRLSRHRGAHRHPGEFKRDQNMIGGRDLQTARFIPPPPAETLDCMSELERYINREPPPTQGQALLDLALVHYQFETIHPFADGNGRVGRMLISLMALSGGLLDTPALYMSPAIEGAKDRYIDLMYAVSAESAWEPWIAFFLGKIAESATNTIGTVDRLLALETDYRERISTIKSGNAATLVSMLFETPAVTPARVAERIGVTDMGARKLLARFEEIGIIRAVENIYPKVYLATGIMSAARK
ncbi:Fic family protein [uncultured Paracoccus sp.]|uniref:Fic family protein n=1 Tax=uncultured Paracoccus sp. TaxID=189685 RepID=UPI00262CE41F|nr:Fic family protein [uncultured Paracoccus sp.]